MEALGWLCLVAAGVLFGRVLMQFVATGRLPLELYLGRWFSLPLALWVLGVPWLLLGGLAIWRHWTRLSAGVLVLPLITGVLVQARWPELGDRLALLPLRWHLGL